MSSSKLYRDENWLRKKVTDGCSPAEIAGMCEVTEPTIKRWIERHGVRPYRDKTWLQNQIDKYVSEQAIADWCCISEQTIKRWMRKFRIKHPGLAPASIMRSFLADEFGELDDVSYRVQILLLWQRHKHRVEYGEIARAVGTTPRYVRQVVGTESNGEIYKIIDSMEFLGSESVPNNLAVEVKARDDRRCVQCEYTQDIEVHHIIPGESTLENLATLCRNCHLEAHEGNFYSSNLAYDTCDGFWKDWVDE